MKASMDACDGPPPESARVLGHPETSEKICRFERIAKASSSMEDDASPLAHEQVVAEQLLEPPRKSYVARHEPMAAQVEPPPITLVRCAQSSDEGLTLEDNGSSSQLTELPRCGKSAGTPTQYDERTGRCASIVHAREL
jgi:hypothetical protein